MDPAIAPLLLVAFVAAMASTWIELKGSLQPASCKECPHCREDGERRRLADVEKSRREEELRRLYARRFRPPEEEDEERRR